MCALPPRRMACARPDNPGARSALFTMSGRFQVECAHADDPPRYALLAPQGVRERLEPRLARVC